MAAVSFELALVVLWWFAGLLRANDLREGGNAQGALILLAVAAAATAIALPAVLAAGLSERSSPASTSLLTSAALALLGTLGGLLIVTVVFNV